MNIIVNGATRGIGRETVKYLAQNTDNKLIITGRSKDDLDKIKKEFSNVEVFSIDISRFDEFREEFIELIQREFESIDILINTVGVLKKAMFDVFTESDARLVMETNFFGPASVIRALRKLMHNESHIVNISSMGGFQGSEKYPGLSYYSASKAAISVLTECLAKEFFVYGIKVNCLAIGAVQTDMLNEAFPGYKAPVEAYEMGKFVADFALNGSRLFNGKILPVALNNP